MKNEKIKILAIGNSFSEDATRYLWQMFNSVGYSDVIIGNMYIGGCTLDTHYANITENRAAYIYYKAETAKSGELVPTNDVSVSSAIKDEDWDIITLQQASVSSGIAETYGNLQSIIDYVKENAANAKIYWHMTWAYQSDSTHGEFYKYNNDQNAMYQAILGCVKSEVLTKSDIVGVIPSGTAIQNLRTSAVGDTLTRDGFHLSHETGRYTAALTWFSALTGSRPDTVSFVPKKTDYPDMRFDIEGGTLDLAAKAVACAIESPYEITCLK